MFSSLVFWLSKLEHTDLRVPFETVKWFSNHFTIILPSDLEVIYIPIIKQISINVITMWAQIIDQTQWRRHLIVTILTCQWYLSLVKSEDKSNSD